MNAVGKSGNPGFANFTDVKLEDIDGYIYNFRRIEDKGLNV
jgi:hypothetical protein